MEESVTLERQEMPQADCLPLLKLKRQPNKPKDQKQGEEQCLDAIGSSVCALGSTWAAVVFKQASSLFSAENKEIHSFLPVSPTHLDS